MPYYPYKVTDPDTVSKLVMNSSGWIECKMWKLVMMVSVKSPLDDCNAPLGRCADPTIRDSGSSPMACECTDGSRWRKFADGLRWWKFADGLRWRWHQMCGVWRRNWEGEGPLLTREELSRLFFGWDRRTRASWVGLLRGLKIGPYPTQMGVGSGGFDPNDRIVRVGFLNGPIYRVGFGLDQQVRRILTPLCRKTTSLKFLSLKISKTT